MLQLYNFRPEILEVNCPFSAKDMTIPEAIETLNDFCLGIWLHESGVLWASPEYGFVQGDPITCNMNVHLQSKLTASPAILEVKCPFSAREMSIKDACANLKDFFLECDSEALFFSKRAMTIGIKFKTNFILQELRGLDTNQYGSYSHSSR